MMGRLTLLRADKGTQASSTLVRKKRLTNIPPITKGASISQFEKRDIAISPANLLQKRIFFKKMDSRSKIRDLMQTFQSGAAITKFGKGKKTYSISRTVILNSLIFIFILRQSRCFLQPD